MGVPSMQLLAAHASGAGAWSPSDLASLELWLDASDTATITASSGAVSQWTDKSVNGHAFVQANAPLKPITGTRTLNGLNVIDFAGAPENSAGQHLLGPLVSTNTDNFSIYIAYRPDDARSYCVPFCNGAGNSSGYGPAHGAGSGTIAGYLRGGLAWHSGTVTPAVNEPHVLMLLRNAGTWTMTLNEVWMVGGTSNPNTPVTYSIVGGHRDIASTGVTMFNGCVAEVLFYEANHDASQQAQVHDYLRDKWGTGEPAPFRQSKFAAASTLTLQSTPTNGNLLVVCTGGTTAASTLASLSTLGYTQRVESNGQGWRTSIWSKIASGESATITVTEGLGSSPHLACFEFEQPMVYNQSASAGSVSANLESITAGPTASLTGSLPAIAVAAVELGASTGSPALSDGFRLMHSDATGIVGYKVLSSTSAVSTTASWTTTRSASISLAAFTT